MERCSAGLDAYGGRLAVTSGWQGWAITGELGQKSNGEGLFLCVAKAEWAGC